MELNEFFKPDFANVTPASDRASIQYLEPVTGKHTRHPLTWDNTKQCFQAADLEADGQVICRAVNVYAFEGALKLGDGKRSKRFMLFELGEVVPVSNLHVAVDKMNTHYFQHGTFERRAFNAKNVRPATPSEVLEYLNAKYQYTLRTANNEAL